MSAPIVRIGAETQWGEVAAVLNIEGERYYAIYGPGNSVALMPSNVVEPSVTPDKLVRQSDPFAPFRHDVTLPTDAEVYVVEAEIFGVSEDGENYCRQTCDDSRHDKFCDQSVGFVEQERTDWARRVAIWRRLYGFNECPFDGGAVYASQGDSCGVWRACQTCGACFAVVERAVDLRRAFVGVERKIVAYVEDERRVVCGVVHPAVFEEVKP